MENKALSALKASVIEFGNNEMGISHAEYSNLHKIVKDTMGADAASILDSNTEGGLVGEVFFPSNIDAAKTWKRMVVAYRIEKGIDKEESCVG